MPSDQKQRKAYEFLLDHAKSQNLFALEDLRSATGWAAQTARTYISKQVHSVVEKAGRSQYRVKRHFIHLEEEDFVKRTSQKESILPSYARVSYDSVLVYEFLMPLTREDLLRRALDRLFFKDSLEKQLALLGLDTFHAVIPLESNEADESYTCRVARKVSDYFGGYSILHASGRFRADRLLTQHDAVGKRYIIDETTAIVRFVIPLEETATRHSHVFDPNVGDGNGHDEAVVREVALIRTLFFTIFAEVVVHSVQGEDQIWLLEALNGNQRLYKWKVQS